MGLFNETTRFTFPTGQYAANSGTYTDANGGIAAVFNSIQVFYRIRKNGVNELSYSMHGDGGTDGSGAVEARFVFPFIPAGEVNGIAGACFFMLTRYALGSYVGGQACFRSGTDHEFWLYRTDTADTLDWVDFSNGDRFVWGTVAYITKFEA